MILGILLPKINAYKKYLVTLSLCVSFIKDDKLLVKSSKIWDKISKVIKKTIR